MKFRRAATLSVSFEDSKFTVTNFLTRQKFHCSEQALGFLSRLDAWRTPKQLLREAPDADASSLAEQVAGLVALGALVVGGTPQAELDEHYRREWQWGVTAGLFHFGVRETRFITGGPARKLIHRQKAWRRSPPLMQSNRDLKSVVTLGRTDLQQEPFALMRRRRSERLFDGSAIPLQALADCLFTGNGVVDTLRDKDFGSLPLTMTPSGGARNPFELYVYASHVKGLKPGFYHYGAKQHDLGLVRAGRVDVPEMLGTQRWPAKAAAIVFMVAHFPRTMWKYHMPMAYRIVMMEAGFIGQNIALAATHHGLSAIPSGALKEPVIEAYLGTPPIESAVVLSVSLGKPKTTRGSTIARKKPMPGL